MSYNPPRAGLINAGSNRTPFPSRGGGVGGAPEARIRNSSYRDQTNPQSVYDRSIAQGKQQYEQSALKQFFDFALSDTVKETYEGVLQQQANNQLGELISNSPDIVEGWKKGNPAERAYVSNLSPFAQNLIEKTLSEQVANDYVGSVNASLASSEILTSASATEEQLSTERSRIMSDASQKTGYGSLNPYWIAQTAPDVSRIQASVEAKIDAERQKNKAALGLTKYGDGLAGYWAKQSAQLNGLKADMSPDELAEAYRSMSRKMEQSVRESTEAMLATPSSHLATFLDGVETQVAKMRANGDDDAALSYLEHLQKAAASRDITVGPGINYFQQRDAAGNSGLERLNAIQTETQRAIEREDGAGARTWAEAQVAKGTPNDEILQQQQKLWPGKRNVIIDVIRGDEQVARIVTEDQRRAGLEFMSRPNKTPEEAMRLIDELDIDYRSNLAQQMMSSAGGTQDSVAQDLETTFTSALKSVEVATEIGQLAYELTDPRKVKNAEVQRVKRGLRVGEAESDQTKLIEAIDRQIRIEVFRELQERQANGEFDGPDAKSKLAVAKELFREQIETLRSQANFKPVPKPKSDKDSNLREKEWLQSYGQRKKDGEVGLDLFDQDFIDNALKKGIINEGMTNETKTRKLGEYLSNKAAGLTDVDKKAIYSTQQVQKIMRGELDPFSLEDAEPDLNEPLNYLPTGSRRRFYRRPEPTPTEEPNPFGEPPRMIDMPPMENEEQEVSSALQSFKQGLFTIANVAVDVLTGAAPASAQLEFEDNAGEMAQIWTGKKPLGIGGPSLPQINGNVVVRTVPIAMSTPRHPYFVAIGIAEGTRTASGGFTKAWFGHGDPGDGNLNRGTVSGGRGPTAGMSPEQVDNYYMKELTGLALAVAPVLQQYGMKPNAQIWHRTIFNYLDLHVQSPVAARDFLKKIPEAIKAGGQIEHFAKIRADSYRDPETGRLYTSFNSYADLLRDQRSRAGAYDYRKRL